MDGFFPQGFWMNVAAIVMVAFLLFGVDLLIFKARLVTGLSRIVNKSFHVDQALIRMLEGIKRASDREYDMEQPLLRGWGRGACGAVLIGAAFLLLYNLLPSLK